MAVRQAGSRWHHGGADGADRLLRRLRGRWRTASIGAGWRFPSDWSIPEVDDVCASVLAGGDLRAVVRDLGTARARSGVGLDETLTDLAALHAVLTTPDQSGGLVAVDADALPGRLVRCAALAWADAALGEVRDGSATESLTGLATSEYLRVRVGEVYRRARRDGVEPPERYLLLTVTLDLSEVEGWSRLMSMVVVGDVLRAVFDGGESIAVLGPSVAIVLAEREPDLAERAARARTMIAEKLAVDRHLAGRPEIRIERLPDNEADAMRLIRAVGHA